jgi:glycosyltransferase involved in cell wall biosynthesis
MMRILYLVHQYPPEFIGGVEVYTQEVARALARRGRQVAVFCRSYAAGHSADTNQQDGITIYRLSTGASSPAQRVLATWRHPGILAHWQRVINEFQPHLVHVQHLMGLPVGLIAYLHRMRIPYLITLWDYWWICANANLLTNYDHSLCDGPKAYLNCARCAVARTGKRSSWILGPLFVSLFADRNRRLKRLLRHAARLIAPSEFVQRWSSQQQLPEDLLLLVKPGIIPVRLPCKRRADHLRVLYVGGLAAHKGVHILVEAIRGVTGAIRLYVAGSLSTHPQYVSQLRQMADERIVFLGELGREETWQAMANADVAAVPSLWHETFCFVAHESLTAETPVLASNVGALPEAVHDGINGFLLPPGEVEAWRSKLQELVDHPQVLHTLKPTRVAPTLEEHTDRLESIYQVIC